MVSGRLQRIEDFYSRRAAVVEKFAVVAYSDCNDEFYICHHSYCPFSLSRRTSIFPFEISAGLKVTIELSVIRLFITKRGII